MKIKQKSLRILGILMGDDYPDIDEHDISRNIKLLKQTDWFKSLLEDEATREVIVHNAKVRYEIGHINSKKLERQLNNVVYQRKLEDRLMSVIEREVL